MAVLPLAEQAARSADLKIAHGNLKAASKLRVLFDCGKPLLRWVCRAGFLALLLFTLVVALMSLFLPGRDDEMLRNNPALYLDVQSWFMLG